MPPEKTKGAVRFVLPLVRRGRFGVGGSTLELGLARLMSIESLPAPETEYRFAPPRRFRFDFCWPGRKLAVEVEGGTYTRGAHVRGAHYESDCRKYNLATLAGYRVLRFTRDMIASGEAVRTIQAALERTAEKKRGDRYFERTK